MRTTCCRLLLICALCLIYSAKGFVVEDFPLKFFVRKGKKFNYVYIINNYINYIKCIRQEGLLRYINSLDYQSGTADNNISPNWSKIHQNNMYLARRAEPPAGGFQWKNKRGYLTNEDNDIGMYFNKIQHLKSLQEIT